MPGSPGLLDELEAAMGSQDVEEKIPRPFNGVAIATIIASAAALATTAVAMVVLVKGNLENSLQIPWLFIGLIFAASGLQGGLILYRSPSAPVLPYVPLVYAIVSIILGGWTIGYEWMHQRTERTAAETQQPIVHVDLTQLEAPSWAVPLTEAQIAAEHYSFHPQSRGAGGRAGRRRLTGRSGGGRTHSS